MLVQDGEGKWPVRQSKPVKRPKPTLILIGGRFMISTGRWNDQLMADFMINYSEGKWIKVGELARIGCGANTIPNKRRVRGRLSSLFMELRSRSVFLAIEYHDNYTAASAVKIADLASDEDMANVTNKLERMKRRKEMSQEQYEKSIALMESLKKKK